MYHSLQILFKHFITLPDIDDYDDVDSLSDSNISLRSGTSSFVPIKSFAVQRPKSVTSSKGSDSKSLVIRSSFPQSWIFDSFDKYAPLFDILIMNL